MLTLRSTSALQSTSGSADRSDRDTAAVDSAAATGAARAKADIEAVAEEDIKFYSRYSKIIPTFKSYHDFVTFA